MSARAIRKRRHRTDYQALLRHALSPKEASKVVGGAQKLKHRGGLAMKLPL